MCTHCTRNMLGTTFVSHTQPWKTPQHRQNREKQENHVVSLSHREIAIASPFRDPQKRPRGITIAWKCSNVHPMYPQYARNNFCQPYPALENTRTLLKSWKTRKSRVFHCHIGNSSPFRDPQNDPEASISPESALMCTQCALNMLGTTLSAMPSPGKHHNIVKSRKTRKSRCFTVT